MMDGENSTVLRVGFVRYPPAVFNSCMHFPELGIRRKCPFPGYCVEMMKLVTQKLNMTLMPVVIGNENSEIDVGALHDDGHWSGMLGAIANGTVDTACIFYQKTESRLPDFDFTLPIYTTHSRIAVRSQNAEATAELWRLFKPYQADTWILIIGFFLLQMAIFAVIKRVEFRLGYCNQFSMPGLIWKALRMQLLQPEVMRFKSAAGKAQLIIFGLIQCIVFTSVYQFWIVSSLVQSKPASPIKDGLQFMKEFREGKYKLVSQYKGHWFYEQLEHSTTFPFKEMREVATKQSISLAHSIIEALQLVQKGDHVLFLQGDDPAYFKASRFCDIVFVDQDIALPSMTSNLVFAKGSPLLDRFNAAINEEIIYVRRIYERYKNLREMIRNQECEEQFAKSRRYQPLSLAPFVGVLIVFGACIGISCIVFLAERFCAMLD